MENDAWGRGLRHRAEVGFIEANAGKGRRRDHDLYNPLVASATNPSPLPIPIAVPLFDSLTLPQASTSSLDRSLATSAPPMFKCTGYGDCQMSFTRSEHLARHVRKHTGERPFQCHCGRTFSRLDNVRQHAGTVHSETPAKNAATMAALVALHNSLSATSAQSQIDRGMVVKDSPGAVAAAAKKARRSKSLEQEKRGALENGFSATAPMRIPSPYAQLPIQVPVHPMQQPGYAPYSQQAPSPYYRVDSPYMHSMSAVGLGSRDPSTLTQQDDALIQGHMRKMGLYPAQPPQFQHYQPPQPYPSSSALYPDAQQQYSQPSYGAVPSTSHSPAPPSPSQARRARPSSVEATPYRYYSPGYSGPPVSPPTPPSSSRVTLPPISQLLPPGTQPSQPETQYYSAPPPPSQHRPMPSGNGYVVPAYDIQPHYNPNPSPGHSPTTTAFYPGYEQHAVYGQRPSSAEPSPSLSNSSSASTESQEQYGYPTQLYSRTSFQIPPSAAYPPNSIDFNYARGPIDRPASAPMWPVVMEQRHDELKQRALDAEYGLGAGSKRSRGVEVDEREDWKRLAVSQA